MPDEWGFDTQIGVVSGATGDNRCGDALVDVDLDTNTYDITATGAGLASERGTATDVPFDSDVNVGTVLSLLDLVA